MGYGMGGRVFHAPFIQAAEGLELAGVVTRSPQRRAVFAGRRPVEDGDAWGYEAEERWGVLRTAAGERRVPSERGAYQDFYSQFARAVRGDGPMPVTGAEAILTLEVLDAARLSDLEGRAVTVG